MMIWPSLAAQPVGESAWSVVSPDGEITLAVRLAKTLDGRNEGGHLLYRVELGSGAERRVVVADSPLGLTVRGMDFLDRLSFESARPQQVVEDVYTLPYGKRSSCHNRGHQRVLTFRDPAGHRLEIETRAYNDGVAFRYRILGAPGVVAVLEAEGTGFALPADARLWCAPSDKATLYSPAYETYYENEMPVGNASPLGVGWSFPMLFSPPDGSFWALLTEANVGTNFCGTRLSNSASSLTYAIRLPNPAEGNGTGQVNPSSTLPWEMPWRVLIIGRSLATIVESTLVTDVSAPATVQETGWIRPGRVAWSWWSDNPSPKSAAKQRKFIDLAAEMGWEYVLVDANWTIMEEGNIHEVLRYAKERNVGILLWYNSGGPHNLVTEKPRDCMTYQPVREFELGLLRGWGVKGVKVDFFQSDKQNVVGLYHGIMEDAAAKQIMVNFHGCTLPRGWERTYPHLMSMEAVRGEECYIFDSSYPDRAPVQNTILPFTRNAVGPMDYTPVGLSNNRYPHRTSTAHELALTVLFTSGWLHFADKPEAYRALAPLPKQFLKEVPVSWDETKYLEGYPGRFAAIARRRGPTWYVAGANAGPAPRELSINPSSWASDAREVTIIGDGADPTEPACETRRLKPNETLVARMLPHGGFVWILRK